MNRLKAMACCLKEKLETSTHSAPYLNLLDAMSAFEVNTVQAWSREVESISEAMLKRPILR